MNDRLFFDTNVLLDQLLDREPFANDADALWSMAESREVVGLISAISFNFVYYIVRHEADERQAIRAIKGLRDIFEAVAVDAQIINQAIDSGFADFEDAIQHSCALRGQATHLVTRDLTGYRKSALPVIHPKAYLHLRSKA
jgi:predicted nucleic acid-binding protein